MAGVDARVAAPGDEPDTPEVVRYLVVANRTSGSAQLHAALHRRGREGGASFYLVVPATDIDEGDASLAWSEHLAAYPGEAPGVTLARHRLRRLLDVLADVGLVVDGEVGDPDPFRAVTEVLRRVPADEIVVSTLGRSNSPWLGAELLQRLKTAFSIPVAHVESRPTIATPPPRRRRRRAVAAR